MYMLYCSLTSSSVFSDPRNCSSNWNCAMTNAMMMHRTTFNLERSIIFYSFSMDSSSEILVHWRCLVSCYVVRSQRPRHPGLIQWSRHQTDGTIKQMAHYTMSTFCQFYINKVIKGLTWITEKICIRQDFHFQWMPKQHLADKEWKRQWHPGDHKAQIK